ncbi:uncharacterized protein LOC111615135 isoform X2 [Centruroides sculpturatus]|uniref:uncharacterized protein LOC111615135 isoform X2 n=1 Tax=Centruroides sculpturatus TaxID=218467 RepID=UPI000C6E4E37|nr:uncharacterized protein LOC111615135 isoform X2 [Centruroides sculpturatus]
MVKFNTNFSIFTIFIFGMILTLKIEATSFKDKKQDHFANRNIIKRETVEDLESWKKLLRIIKALKHFENDLLNRNDHKETRLADINEVIQLMADFSGTEGITVIKPNFARMFHFKLCPFDPTLLKQIQSMIREFEYYSDFIKRTKFYGMDAEDLAKIGLVNK